MMNEFEMTRVGSVGQNDRLMSLIEALSDSVNNEQRDKEKASLEKGFKRSEQKLDELIAANHEYLTLTMQKFSQISAKLSISQQKIITIKDNLMASKELLNCKRDELKKLWLEGIKHKHVLHLLDQVQIVKDVPVKVDDYIKRKYFLHATELIASSTYQLEGDLAEIEGLKEIKLDLQIKKLRLCEKILDELIKQLYVSSTNDNLYPETKFERRKKESLTSKVVDKSFHELGGNVAMASPTHKRYYVPLIVSGLDDIDEETIVEDSKHFIALLIKCISLLDYVPEAVDTIKTRTEKELLNIVRKGTQKIYEEAQLDDDDQLDQKQQSRLLAKLELIFEKFFCVAEAHQLVLMCFKENMTSQKTNVNLYTMEDIWGKIQEVLRVVLSDYLDIQNAATNQTDNESAFNDANIDINSYFKKKRRAPSKNNRLFKFENKGNGISNYVSQEAKQGYLELDGGEVSNQDKILVAQPDAQNITVIFKPLMKFIGEIESALNYLEGNHCMLHRFVTDYVKDVYLTRIYENMTYKLEEANKSLDAWVLADPKKQKDYNISIQLLESTVIIDNGIQQLRQTMSDYLPQYSDNFLNMICNILVNYRDMCEAAFKGVIQPESAEKRIFSSTWAQDENISLFLRTLPNWKNLQQLKHNRTPDYEESHEEIRQRNLKESNVLIENIHLTTIPRHEILGDVALLRVLALLHESLEWFGNRVADFARCLPSNKNLPSNNQAMLDISPVAENTIQSLLQVSRDFTDLADKCLLILHLEVRVHCFYYLLPLFKQGIFLHRTTTKQNPDVEVSELNKDLLCIEYALHTSLQPRKFNYVFEGLGQLLASILINSARCIQRINENGVKKICGNIVAIQQTLMNITASREIALDPALEYYEMLFRSTEDFFNKIVDQGPQFSEAEYETAVKLLLQSRNEGQGDAFVHETGKHLERLRNILSEVTTRQNSL